MNRNLDLKKSLILSFLIFLFFILIFVLTEKRGNVFLTGKIFYSIFLFILSFFVFYTGKISFYRSILFITTAVSFILVYKTRLWGVSRSFFLAPAENSPEVPVCHIALASNFAITFFDQLKAAFIYGWGQWGFYTIGILYVFSTLAVGQAFCSWVCFYGGIDETMSKIPRKQVLKINNVPKMVRDFPVGFWIFLMLASIILFEPFFCLWICPFKLTTAFLNKGDLFVYKMQIIIFVSVGILFLVVLPLLSKKRTFCSFICPFGGFISVAGRINPFKVYRDKKKCEKCGKCIEVCPNFAITKDYEVTSYCVRCGRCIDNCTKNAIFLGIKSENEKIQKAGYVIFLLCVFLFSGAISSFFVPDAIAIILKLIKLAG
ncbi:MAG: 4Fe-4S binding protein [Candidatus Goldbacteria bacterium]|nr:4Fe-4S binding protein [Candidatus Goldiibacteriota bacterium]